MSCCSSCADVWPAGPHVGLLVDERYLSDGQWADLINTQETAANAQAGQLREQISTLTEQLTAVETGLAPLHLLLAVLVTGTGMQERDGGRPLL
jgi:hypothetical protein